MSAVARLEEEMDDNISKCRRPFLQKEQLPKLCAEHSDNFQRQTTRITHSFCRHEHHVSERRLLICVAANNVTLFMCELNAVAVYVTDLCPTVRRPENSFGTALKR